jgi:hypothetical protein
MAQANPVPPNYSIKYNELRSSLVFVDLLLCNIDILLTTFLKITHHKIHGGNQENDNSVCSRGHNMVAGERRRPPRPSKAFPSSGIKVQSKITEGYRRGAPMCAPRAGGHAGPPLPKITV